MLIAARTKACARETSVRNPWDSHLRRILGVMSEVVGVVGTIVSQRSEVHRMVVHGPTVLEPSLRTDHILILISGDRLTREGRVGGIPGVPLPQDSAVIAEHRAEPLVGADHLIDFDVISVPVQHRRRGTDPGGVPEVSAEQRCGKQGKKDRIGLAEFRGWNDIAGEGVANGSSLGGREEGDRVNLSCCHTSSGRGIVDFIRENRPPQCVRPNLSPKEGTEVSFHHCRGGYRGGAVVGKVREAISLVAEEEESFVLAYRPPNRAAEVVFLLIVLRRAK